MAAPLTLLVALALGAAPPAREPPSTPPALAQAAVAASLALPGARAELLELSGTLPGGCAAERAELPRPVTASGRFALQLAGRAAGGRACQGWMWARVRVSAPTLVTRRAVVAGEPLAEAVVTEVRPVDAGRPPVSELPEGATAARPLPAGARIEADLLRSGPRPGAPVVVVLRAGTLEVEQHAQALACRRGRACALLPSGRRVEGRWHGGRIELDP